MVSAMCEENESGDDEAGNWFDAAVVDAEHWFSLSEVSPEHAAMLLCQFNPNIESFEEARLVTNGETGPMDLLRLRQRLEDEQTSSGVRRSLLEWFRFAKAQKLKHHSWIDRCIELLPKSDVLREDEPERRLRLLRALGGSAKRRNGGWKFTGVTYLVAAEKQDGRKRTDEKTIRKDLREAAEAEEEARRAGLQIAGLMRSK